MSPASDLNTAYMMYIGSTVIISFFTSVTISHDSRLRRQCVRPITSDYSLLCDCSAFEIVWFNVLLCFTDMSVTYATITVICYTCLTHLRRLISPHGSASSCHCSHRWGSHHQLWQESIIMVQSSASVLLQRRKGGCHGMIVFVTS